MNSSNVVLIKCRSIKCHLIKCHLIKCCLIKCRSIKCCLSTGIEPMDALFILRMQEGYFNKKKKLFVCFVNLEKTFAQVPKKVIE